MAEELLSTEEWAVVGVAPNYEVSTLGRVRRVIGNGEFRILRPAKTRLGYLRIELSNNGKSSRHYVHSLVLEAFRGPKPEGYETAHGDGVRGNNCIENLRWATRAENMRDKIVHGTCYRPAGTMHVNAKLTDEAVRIIRAAPRRNGIREALAKQFGVAVGTINTIRTRGKAWRHVEPLE